MSDGITLVLQQEVPIIIGLTTLLCGLCVWVSRKIRAADPFEKPTGAVLLGCWLVETVDHMVEDIINQKYAKKLAPYIGTVAIYIFLSNITGLFGFSAPTQNFSVTLVLALITWVMIQKTCIKENGFKSYLKGYVEPFAFLLIPNFFGRISPLISMSLRLFGNVLSGTLIMSLIYSFTEWISTTIFSFIPLTQINLVGPFITPIFHAYFDVFVGFIQMFIFITLTMVFIGNELPQEE
ncbi:MAG: F0F1 ATP synthase subunit A [Anaerorhabdus sp.]